VTGASHYFRGYFEYFIFLNFCHSAIPGDRLALSLGAPKSREIFGRNILVLIDAGFRRVRHRSAAVGRLRRARVRNRDDFSGAMHSSSSRGQRPADDDQEKSSERVFKAHRYK